MRWNRIFRWRESPERKVERALNQSERLTKKKWKLFAVLLGKWGLAALAVKFLAVPVAAATVVALWVAYGLYAGKETGILDRIFDRIKAPFKERVALAQA